MPHIFLFIYIYCLATTRPETPSQAIINPLINLKFKSVLRNQTGKSPGDLERAAPRASDRFSLRFLHFRALCFILLAERFVFYVQTVSPFPGFVTDINTSEQLEQYYFNETGRNNYFFIKKFFFIIFFIFIFEICLNATFDGYLVCFQNGSQRKAVSGLTFLTRLCQRNRKTATFILM